MKNYIEAQSSEYQKYLTKTKDLESIIHHQQNMLNQKSIPNVYQPKPLKTDNFRLVEEFNKKYESLFTEHLNKVTTSNIINLEIHRAAMNSIVAQTEHYLCSLPLPQEEISTTYYKFLANNNIHHHIPSPELQAKLAEISPTNANPNQGKKRRQKRKNNSSHPQGTKNIKTSQTSFLFQGPKKSTPATLTIHNLSSLSLSLKLLNKGLSFAPTKIEHAQTNIKRI